jgi:hypothetical protein
VGGPRVIVIPEFAEGKYPGTRGLSDAVIGVLGTGSRAPPSAGMTICSPNRYPISEPLGSAARMSASGSPSSLRTIFVPRTSETIL